MALDVDLDALEKTALEQATAARSENELAEIRSKLLGKKGTLGLALKGMGKLSPEERKSEGQRINQTKARIESAMRDAEARLEADAQERALRDGRFDVTLPGRRIGQGAAHPLRLIEERVIECLTPLGFTVADGPLIEHDWYNFEALNFPANHPSRDMQDTFFLGPEVLLRTHTSNVQIRTMEKRPAPVRVLAPGMVFRKDEVDATHSPVFHQIEGLWVDEGTTFSDLKGVLKRIAIHLFGADTEVRFRPSFFPFTEPSLEMDVKAPGLAGGTGWMELLGAGMVHPNVLSAVGYDPEQVQGFAFGMGIERLAMQAFGVDDIRNFYENDLRFLEQFGPRGARVRG
ncbi:MAG: phenylalanine--tRNA ligase subunit alpha [Myxococcota bacterium]